MPSVLEHYQQSEHNQKLLDALPEGFPDWEVTLRFYIALHLVNAWLVRHGHPAMHTHAETGKTLSASRFDPRARMAYKSLEIDSRVARYDCPDPLVIAGLVESAQSALEQIRSAVMPWIKSDI